MKVLFFSGGPGYLRQYGTLWQELARRGHGVHVAFQQAKGPLPEDAARVLDDAGISHGFAPERPADDGWRAAASEVRALADLARYAHPRYERAPELRARMESKVIARLRKSDACGHALAVATRLASGSDEAFAAEVIGAMAKVEQRIPTSPEIDRYIADHRPDVVLATPLVNRASTQVEYLKSARKLGIAAGTCVASWDNLTNKGLLKWVPERVFVWNEIQRREAVELHGIPAERVVATGAQLFDAWFERRPSTSREELAAKAGLDAARPYVLYTCSNPAMTETPESQFVLAWADALRADERLREVGVLIRPHPNDKGEWTAIDPGHENVAIWPRGGARTVTEAARADFFDSLAHSAAVVGINTTAMIEAAIVGKSVLTVLNAEFAQESTLHFDYLLEENGGFLHVADSLPGHVGQLAQVLEQDEAGAERRRRFVESFVRPHGLDRPATPILADAVEELAQARVAPPEGSDSLYPEPLGVEAALASLDARLGARA